MTKYARIIDIEKCRRCFISIRTINMIMENEWTEVKEIIPPRRSPSNEGEIGVRLKGSSYIFPMSGLEMRKNRSKESLQEVLVK